MPSIAPFSSAAALLCATLLGACAPLPPTAPTPAGESADVLAPNRNGVPGVMKPESQPPSLARIAELVNGRNVWMVEPGERERFFTESAS